MKSVSPTYIPAPRTSRCCNTGHPVLADPMTGRTVCSCQLQTGIPAYLSRVPSLPETLYNQSITKHSKGSTMPELNTSAFISTHTGDKHRPGLNLQAPAIHPYYPQHVVPSHPYANIYPGFDINGVRRKTTNREATGPLKAWLYQHRKNPYPTKGEKVMLAIISQMTLTQVSTWFANARRRLKKESKMDDKGLDLTDIDINDTSIQNESICSRSSDSDSESISRVPNSDISDISDTEEQSVREKVCLQRLFSPDGRTEIFLERHPSPLTLSPTVDNEKQTVHGNSDDETKDSIDVTDGDVEKLVNNKTDEKKEVQQSQKHQSRSKIWSIADMIG